MIHFGAASSFASSHSFSSLPAGYSGVSKKGPGLPEGPAGLRVLSYAKDELPGARYKFTDHRIRVARPGYSYLNEINPQKKWIVMSSTNSQSSTFVR